jgi:ATP-dependent RNA helicase DeaD
MPALPRVSEGFRLSTSVSQSAPAEAGSFSALSLKPATRAALTRMGIETPTPIQARALPALLAGRDIIGQARTGSGKTLAFGIPAVELVKPNERFPQVLILTPTRELAVQVGQVLSDLSAGQNISTVLIYGGRAMGPQRDALRRGAQIVVGTPGRVDDLFNQGALRLDGIRFLVLDEADEMLDRGFGPQVQKIIQRTPTKRQTALFSATVPEWVHDTAAKHLTKPLLVEVDTNPEDVPAIDHVAYDVPDGEKINVLRHLLDQRGDGQMIVFGRTKHGVKKLAKQLESAGYPIAALQGNLSQNARDRVMEDFRAGRVKILLATNVAARGLDISAVDQVINYELPESSELLTHRVGRTGRMGRAGRAITLLTSEDAAKWRQLERGLGARVSRQPWRGGLAPVAPAARVQREEIAPASRPILTAPRLRPTWTNAPVSHEASTSAPRERTNAFPRRQSQPARPTQPAAAKPAREKRAAKATPAPRPSASLTSSKGERHEIICSGCGKASSIGFEPDYSRPIYCNACHKARQAARNGDPARSFRGGQPAADRS